MVINPSTGQTINKSSEPISSNDIATVLMETVFQVLAKPLTTAPVLLVPPKLAPVQALAKPLTMAPVLSIPPKLAQVLAKPLTTESIAVLSVESAVTLLSKPQARWFLLHPIHWLSTSQATSTNVMNQ